MAQRFEVALRCVEGTSRRRGGEDRKDGKDGERCVGLLASSAFATAPHFSLSPSGRGRGEGPYGARGWLVPRAFALMHEQAQRPAPSYFVSMRAPQNLPQPPSPPTASTLATFPRAPTPHPGLLPGGEKEKCGAIARTLEADATLHLLSATTPRSPRHAPQCHPRIARPSKMRKHQVLCSPPPRAFALRPFLFGYFLFGPTKRK